MNSFLLGHQNSTDVKRKGSDEPVTSTPIVKQNQQSASEPTSPNSFVFTHTVSTNISASNSATFWANTTAQSAMGFSQNVQRVEPIDIDSLSTAIWMGPPGWEDKAVEESDNLQDLPFLSGPESRPVLNPSIQGSLESIEVEIPGAVEQSNRCRQSPSGSQRLSTIERSSSPSLLTEGAGLHRTSSDEVQKDFERLNKGNKTAWGRVKDIIHTRRDSLKRRSKVLDIDISSDPDISPRGSPHTQHKAILKAGDQEVPTRGSPAHTPQASPKTLPKVTKKIAKSVDMSANFGPVSNEFTKKLQEWEQIKSKKFVHKEVQEPAVSKEIAQMDLATNLSDDFKEKLDEWNCKKGVNKSFTATSPILNNNNVKHPPDVTVEESPESVLPGDPDPVVPHAITEQPGSPSNDGPKLNLETLQQNMSDSFNRKMMEWERKKYRRDVSVSPERKNIEKNRSKSNKTKSKQPNEERGRTKFRRQKLRKERSKTLDRKIDLHGNDRQAEVIIQTENGVYKVSEDFAQKLQEWESIKQSTTKSDIFQSPERVDHHTDNEEPLSTNQHVCFDSSIQLGDEGQQPKSLLEEMNHQLQNDLRLKEQEHAKLKTELRKMKQKLWHATREQSSPAGNTTSVHHSLDIIKVKPSLNIEESILSQLKAKFSELEQNSERLSKEKQEIEMRAIKEVEDRAQIEARLLEEVKNLKASTGCKDPEQVKNILNFEKFFDYTLKLHTKLQDLKVGVLERNKLISEMKRQLVLLEVTNMLLTADASRRQQELSYYKEARTRNKRWKTYGGIELPIRQEADGSSDPEMEMVKQRCVSLQNTFKGFDKIFDHFEHALSDVEDKDPDWMQTLKAAGVLALDGNTKTESEITCQQSPTPNLQSTEEAVTFAQKQSIFEKATPEPKAKITGKPTQTQTLYKPLTEFEKFRERERLRRINVGTVYKTTEVSKPVVSRKTSDSQVYSTSSAVQGKEDSQSDVKTEIGEVNRQTAKSLILAAIDKKRSKSQSSTSSCSNNESDTSNSLTPVAGGSDGDRSMSVSSNDKTLDLSVTIEDSAIRSARATRERARKVREEVLLMRQESDTSESPTANASTMGSDLFNQDSKNSSSIIEGPSENKTESCNESRMGYRSRSRKMISETSTESEESFENGRNTIPKWRKRSFSTGSKNDRKSSLWKDDDVRSKDKVAPVKDMISKFENSSDGEAHPVQKSFDVSLKSSGHKLKSAAELLEDSQTKRRSRFCKYEASSGRKMSDNSNQASSKESRSISQGRTSAKVQELVKKLSRDSTPERPRSLGSTPNSGTPTRSLSPNPRPYSYPSETFISKYRKVSAISPDTEMPPVSSPLYTKPPLHNSTNEKRVQKLRENFHVTQRSEIRESSPDVLPAMENRDKTFNIGRRRSYEHPKDGTVLKNMEIYEQKSHTLEKSDSSRRKEVRLNSPEECLDITDVKGIADQPEENPAHFPPIKATETLSSVTVSAHSKAKTRTEASAKFCCSTKTNSLPSTNQSFETEVTVPSSAMQNITTNNNVTPNTDSCQSKSSNDLHSPLLVTTPTSEKKSPKRTDKGRKEDENSDKKKEKRSWLEKPKRFFKISKC